MNFMKGSCITFNAGFLPSTVFAEKTHQQSQSSNQREDLVKFNCVEINVSIEKGKTNEAFTPRYQCNEVVDLENDGETPEVPQSSKIQ